MKVKRTYKVRLYPNEAQERELLKTLSGCQWVWNYFLKEITDRYANTGKNPTKKQQIELDVWEYFKPAGIQWVKKNSKDTQKFFEWSQEGKHRDLATIPAHQKEGRTYFHALVWGKKRAYIHAHELYEPAVLEGLGYVSFIDKDTPRAVVEFLKKEMFKGIDAEIIEKFYQSLLEDNDIKE